jgi:hypothetical protein
MIAASSFARSFRAARTRSIVITIWACQKIPSSLGLDRRRMAQNAGDHLERETDRVEH